MRVSIPKTILKILGVCAALILMLLLMILLVFEPVATEENVRALLEEHQHTLMNIAEEVDIGYRTTDDTRFSIAHRFFFFCHPEIQSVRCDENGIVSFHLTSYLEGSTEILYCPDELLTSYEHPYFDSLPISSFQEVSNTGIRTDGLGINGQGHIYIVKLRPNYYFMDAYLPT